MKKVIFDIETKNIFSDVNSNNPADLDISVLCLWDSETNEYHSFLEEDFDKMWPFFKNTETLVTFNGNHFDIPLLQKYCPFDLSEKKSLDLLEEVRLSLGKRIGLDSIAQATLGTQKSANGLQAVAWWNEGKINEIIKYCIDDVKVTKQVYDYALEKQELNYFDRITGEKKDIKLNTSAWEKSDDKPAETGMLF